MQEPLHLADLPNCEARRLLDAGAPAWLCVNPVEYHGPHLSLHNDRLVSERLSARLHARLWPDTPMLLCDDLEAGVEPVPGPGTRALPFSTVRELVLAAVRGLRDLGAKRVVLMTFHGAPLHSLALHAGVDWLNAHGARAVAPFHLLMQQLVEPSLELLDAAVAGVPPERREQARVDLPHDYHAGTFETSLALWLAPESVSPVHRELPDCPPFSPDAALLRAASAAQAVGRRALAAELRFAAWGLGWMKVRPFPGYTGRPAWASTGIGEAFGELLLEMYAKAVPEILDGRREHPAAVMSWLARATLGGRLPTGASLGHA